MYSNTPVLVNFNDLSEKKLFTLFHRYFQFYWFVAERYRIKSEFSVKLDFRTTKTNGVLISLSDYTGVPSLGLVLLDGKVSKKEYTAKNKL